MPVRPLPREPVPAPLVGARVRQLRRRAGLTVEQLAVAVEVDKGHISRIENDLRAPSVAMLAQLAKALKTSISHLLGETLDRAEIRVTRAKELRAPPREAQDPAEHHVLPLRHGKTVASFEAFLVRPGKDPGETEARHAGQEMIYMLSGSVEVLFQGHSVILHAGDCIHFPGHLHHRLKRVGRARAMALLVLSNS